MKCELFERWAAFDGNCDEIRKAGHFVHARQVELARWQHRNFPTSDDRDFALGVAEECGEYFEAKNADEKKDAKGDIAIYLGQLLMANRLSIEPMLLAPKYTPMPNTIAPARLCHAVLKRHQRIRGMEDDEQWRVALQNAARNIINAYSIGASDYLVTSDSVLRRDWRKSA